MTSAKTRDGLSSGMNPYRYVSEYWSPVLTPTFPIHCGTTTAAGFHVLDSACRSSKADSGLLRMPLLGESQF